MYRCFHDGNKTVSPLKGADSERSAVVWCILPVCRVRVAYTLMQTWCGGFVFGFRDLLWVSVGQHFIFGALCPSKSGLMNKHIVKHIEGLGFRGFPYEASYSAAIIHTFMVPGTYKSGPRRSPLARCVRALPRNAQFVRL